MDKFHRLRSHPGKNWPKLRDWYMRTRGTKPDEYQTPPELMIASALQVLSTVPSDWRASAMHVMVESLKTIHAGLPLPEWVGMFSELADKEGHD
ncbi:MAG TPA: hypothetical protein VFS20_12985 [Longimicrobium sp.]|nr:hypothetical protein [Longimicrobium sp.]